ncbi:efflux RND transporter periplasmic adaptor subunit [Nevskia soli]|uniref:efflux RND transporter periplasmic adaptor subunit n=1 Tax=Nevskia soli TaxID=418856 RepID=UPI0015D73710|nr:efflux RND transporter periplasmic adaptor subunit [Nevskia soli]
MNPPDPSSTVVTEPPPARPKVAAPLPPRPTPPPVKPRRTGWIGWLVLLLLILGAGYWYMHTRGEKKQDTTGASGKAGGRRGAGGAIPVAIATVKKGNIGEYINALGVVTPVATVTLQSRVTGQLMEIYYKEGQIVQKGAKLAKIDPRPYEAAVTQAQGQLERDQALLKNAQIDLERYKTAFEQHAIPEQQLATQQATVNQDAGTVKLDEGNLAAAQVNIVYTDIIAPVTGRVGLRTVDPGNIVQANGNVGITITQLQPITVIFNMSEDYLSDVVPQMKSGRPLRVDALDRSQQTEIAQGSLLTLDNQIDTTTGNVKARAVFGNQDNKLFPNEFVNARLLVKTLNGVNLIPTDAIQRNQDEAYVYIMTPGGAPDAQQDTTAKGSKSPHAKSPPEAGEPGNPAPGTQQRSGANGGGGRGGVVHARDIKIATTNGETSAVTGVNPGEILITDGFDRLTEGARVTVKPQVTVKPMSESGNVNVGQTSVQTQTEGSSPPVSVKPGPPTAPVANPPGSPGVKNLRNPRSSSKARPTHNQ